MAETIKICKHNINGTGYCDILGGYCVEGPCSHEELDEYAPVRHGRWEAMHYEGGILDGTNFDKCSVCGYERIFEDEKLKTAFNYCPNCGADMREKEE